MNNFPLLTQFVNTARCINRLIMTGDGFSFCLAAEGKTKYNTSFSIFRVKAVSGYAYRILSFFPPPDINTTKY